MNLFSWLKENTSIVLFVLFLSLAVYFEEGRQIYFVIAALGTMLLSNKENVAICFILQTFMCDNLVLLPSLSFASVASGIFLLKSVIFGSKNVLPKKGILLVVAVIVIQLFSIVIYENTLLNVARLGANLFAALYFSNYSTIFRNKGVLLIPAMISITVLIACFIGLGRSASLDEFGVMRFSGIWIDDNFCGMYCILGILSSVYAILISRRTMIFAIPSILLSSYMATLAMSRTFLYVMVIVAFFILLAFSKSKTFGLFPKLFFYSLFVIAGYYFVIDVAVPIIDVRGYVDERTEDFTNGRIELSLQSLTAFINSPLAWFFGVGVSNTEHFKFINDFYPKMTHNTYVDILVEFGLLMFVYVIIFVAKFFLKVFKSISFVLPYTVLFTIIVLCYMGTLTMGQYSILYIAFGMLYDFLYTPTDKNLAGFKVKKNRHYE